MDNSAKANKDGIKQSHTSVMPQDSIKDNGTFNFLNGDKYEGEYLATKVPLSIVREGVGTYWTNDDSIYKGCWAKDYLVEADPITFPDKSQFHGILENMTTKGPGTYKYKEGVEIHGFFFDNQLGELKLKDPTGHYWRPVNSKYTTEIFFSPVQLFWESVINSDNYLSPYETYGSP